LPLWAQMGRGAVGETDRIMASPIAPRGYRPPLGTYRLVVPGGGPLDLTGGAPAHAEDVVAIFGPSALRVGKSLTAGVAATAPSGRHFLGRVLLDEGGPRDPVRRRIRVGAPTRGPGLPEVTAADVVAQLLGPTQPLSAAQVHFLDSQGNNNGLFDIGDFLAWVKATGAPVSPAMLQQLSRGGRP